MHRGLGDDAWVPGGCRAHPRPLERSGKGARTAGRKERSTDPPQNPVTGVWKRVAPVTTSVRRSPQKAHPAQGAHAPTPQRERFDAHDLRRGVRFDPEAERH